MIFKKHIIIYFKYIKNINLFKISKKYILKQSKELFDYAVIPVGGGGLLAGSCLAASQIDKNMKIIGAEPTEKADLYNSLKEN